MVGSSQNNESELKAMRVLLGLSNQARAAQNLDELNFLLVNASYQLVRFGQSFLWIGAHKPAKASGVIEPTHKTPMTYWLTDFHKNYLSDLASGVITPDDVDQAMQDSWGEYLPPNCLWLNSDPKSMLGCLLARNIPWTDFELNLIYQWWNIWLHARQSIEIKQHSVKKPIGERFLSYLYNRQAPWYKRRLFLLATPVLFAAFFPVPMTVIAPGQIIASDPVRVTMPIDGVVYQVAVEPGSVVEAGDVLLKLEDAELIARLETATQSLETARANLQQVSQQALRDSRFMDRLAEIRGSIQERTVERDFLEKQLQQTTIRSTRSGVVVYDKSSSLVGDIVSLGQHVMSIIDPEDKELEVWLSIADAIPLAEGAGVKLHLNATPFRPVEGTIRFISYDVVERPDGSYAYQVRASLLTKTEHRVGLRGTARLSGEKTTLFYFLMRRPMGALRSMVGF